MKEGGRAPPPSPAWADLTLMIECTPESGHCHSVCTLWYKFIQLDTVMITELNSQKVMYGFQLFF